MSVLSSFFRLSSSSGPYRNPESGGITWYHGTNQEFYPTPSKHENPGGQLAAPDRSYMDNEDQKGHHWNTDLGVHFTSRPETAREFAHSDVMGGSFLSSHSRIAHANLHMKNPKHYESEYDLTKDAVEWAHKKGHHYLDAEHRRSPEVTEYMEHHGRGYDPHPWDDEFTRDPDYPQLANIPGHEHLDYIDDALDGGSESRKHALIDIDRHGPPVHHRGHGRDLDAYLTLHPHRDHIVAGFKKHLQDQGHDGIIYGNEYEGESQHPCAITFGDHQIHQRKWQWLHPTKQHLNRDLVIDTDAPAPRQPETLFDLHRDPDLRYKDPDFDEDESHWKSHDNQRISTLLQQQWYAVGDPGLTRSASVQDWFHGSSRPEAFERFDITKDRPEMQEPKHWNSLLGSHFTPEHHTAAEIAHGFGGNVYHVALRVKNPKHYESEYDLADEARIWAEKQGHSFDDVDPGVFSQTQSEVEERLRHHPRIREIANGFKQHLVDQGHDGIVYGNQYEGSHLHGCAIAFHPDDIDIHYIHPSHEHCGVSDTCVDCGQSHQPSRAVSHCDYCGSPEIERAHPFYRHSLRRRASTEQPVWRQSRPEHDPEAGYEVNSARREHWRTEVRKALSRGDLHPQEAKDLGYHGTGHDQTSGRWDDPPHGLSWEHLPHTLWHTTTDVPGVLLHGLRTRDDLGQRGGAGLGGGESDTVSLTDDPKVAHDIHRSLQEYHSVLNGKTTPKDLMEQAKAGGFEKHMVYGHGGPHPDSGEWKSGDPYPQGLQDVLDGTRTVNQSRTAEEARQEWGDRATPHPKAATIKTPSGDIHTAWKVHPSEKELMHDRSQFYKSFATWREFTGGHKDPGFIMNDPEDLAAKDPSKFGVVKVHPKAGAQGYRVSALGEWRTADGSALHVTPDESLHHTATYTREYHLTPRRWGKTAALDEERAKRLFGKGLGAMFNEHSGPVTIVPWQHARRTKYEPLYDQDSVTEALHRVRRGDPEFKDYDPRELRATQPNITHQALHHYMNVDLRGPDYETFADQGRISNKYPVVYEHKNGERVILVGHHRAAAALLKGEPLRAVRVVDPDLQSSDSVPVPGRSTAEPDRRQDGEDGLRGREGHLSGWFGSAALRSLGRGRGGSASDVAGQSARGQADALRQDGQPRSLLTGSRYDAAAAGAAASQGERGSHSRVGGKGRRPGRPQSVDQPRGDAQEAGQPARLTPRPHRKVEKDLAGLDRPTRQQALQRIEEIASGDTHGHDIHALKGNLKGWYSTKISRGHRVVHQARGGDLNLLYVGLHDYDEAARRVGTLLPGYEREHDWLPDTGVFSATKANLDPVLFTARGRLRGCVKKVLQQRLDAALREEYPDWQRWSRVYFAGGEASHWWGNHDLDLLVGVQYDWFRQAHPEDAALTDEQISQKITGLFRRGYNSETWTAPWDGEEWHVTAYVNPNSWDIRDIKPYGAYLLDTDTWVVKPPKTPEDWGPGKWDEGVWDAAEGYLSAIDGIDRIKDPKIQAREGAALYDYLHGHRREAFSEHGHGWKDPANALWKFLEYHPSNPVEKLVNWAHRWNEARVPQVVS